MAGVRSYWRTADCALLAAAMYAPIAQVMPGLDSIQLKIIGAMAPPKMAPNITPEVIQPITLDIKFNDEHGANVTGLLGIDRERLAALDAEPLHALHKAGYLEGAYLVMASMHNLRRLITEKQRRLGQQETVANAG